MNKIEKFWRVFEHHREAVERLTSADDPLYDEILTHLQDIEPGLYYEFSVSAGERELVITADGDPQLFSVVDQIVRQAPHIAGWCIQSLKPKIGFPVTSTWDGHSVVIADVRFRPIHAAGTRMIDLELFVANIDEVSCDAAHNAILRAIDHGLGERRFAEAISGTSVVIGPSNAADSETYPLTFLEEYITSHC